MDVSPESASPTYLLAIEGCLPRSVNTLLADVIALFEFAHNINLLLFLDIPLMDSYGVDRAI